MDQLYTQLKNYGKVKIDEPMSKHTSYKIGGPAKYFVVVEDVNKFIELLKYLDGEGERYMILGGGSNVLVKDERYDGVIVQIRDQNIIIKDQIVEASAGCPTVRIAQESIKAGLTGFEWGVGVPGTIGGAVRGNAGAMGSDMSKTVTKVEVYRDGEVFELHNEDCTFGYRDSVFKHDGGVIVRVWLKLEKGENKDLQKKALMYMDQRNKTQPKGNSSGCIFKNVECNMMNAELLKNIPAEFVERGFIPAGWLIDQCGLKGYRVGNAEVSEMHGNFIVNLGGATAEDILSIVDRIKEDVYTKFSINLEEEIFII